MSNFVKIGKYQHFKGGQYEVLGVAKHSETLEEYVVYKSLSDEKEIWIRPVEMFLEEVDYKNGALSERVPRFKYLGE